LLSQSNSTNGSTIFLNLKPWDERSKHDALDSIAARLNGKLFAMREAQAFGFNLPEVPGLGLTAGVEVNLQNRSGQDIRQFAQHVQEFRGAANQLSSAGALNSTFRANVPQVYVTVDRTAAKARGVNLTDLFATLQAFLSSLYINDFNLSGKTYRVQAKAAERFRQSPSDIGRLYVRGSSDQMVPVAALTSTGFRGAPSVISRFNGFTSAQFTGTPKPGHSTGELLNQIEQLIQTQFASAGLGVSYSGQSFQERASSGDAALVFVLGLVMVFLVLAAQFESWSVPFAVLLGVPFGVLGALLGIWLRGQPNDIYFQVGLITVVGLAAKNAILIVEFATELRAQGLELREAAIEAARERLRPILMTSFAFILGVMPLVVSTGAGSASRNAIGTGVAGGMLAATALGIFLIPAFYVVVRRIFKVKKKSALRSEPGFEDPGRSKEPIV
jgi:hydrophobe/amphiphile efflux-1 (HAE1) family protein